MDLQLGGAAVLVTAASQGLGKAVASAFVDEGARVVISSRSEANLADAKEDILDATGADADAVRTVACDLGSEDEIRSLVADTVDWFDQLDVLVTNHGGPPARTFTETSVEEFDETYREVLRSTIVLVDEAIDHLRANGGGAITNMVSASAQEPPAGHVLSNTLRPGIYGLSKSLSNEYADEDIRVNCVCPRGVLTDRIEYKIEVLAEREDVSIEQATQYRRDELPIDRLGDPDEFARAVLFVSSEAASFVTGSTLPVDGGWLKKSF